MTDYEPKEETKIPADPALKLMRVQTALLAGVLVLLIAAGVFLAVQFSALHSCMDLINQDLQALDMTALNDTVEALKEAAGGLSGIDIERLNSTVVSLKDAADALGSVDVGRLNTAVGSLKDAADSLGSVDIGELNRAITSLKDAADNLKDIDVNSLNSLVSALDAVSTRLQNAVGALTGIFNR